MKTDQSHDHAGRPDRHGSRMGLESGDPLSLGVGPFRDALDGLHRRLQKTSGEGEEQQPSPTVQQRPEERNHQDPALGPELVQLLSRIGGPGQADRDEPDPRGRGEEDAGGARRQVTAPAQGAERPPADQRGKQQARPPTVHRQQEADQGCQPEVDPITEAILLRKFAQRRGGHGSRVY